MTASLSRVAVPAGISFSTKKFRRRIAHCIGGLPMILLNALVGKSAVGQNQMLPSTTPRTRSARATSTAMLIGPPQSWPIVT
jgi:hypothetical protein